MNIEQTSFYKSLKWDVNTIKQHRFLCQQYEDSAKEYTLSMKFLKVPPTEVMNRHHEASRALSMFLDQMKINKIIKH